MRYLPELFERNRAWAAGHVAADPQFFERLCDIQQPEYLWIGCADSRVPANEIVGLAPGEMFVHRNVANLVVPGDLNCMAVVQYAIDVLNVRHIIVTGHYGCGGVLAALRNEKLGLIDNWLRHVQDVLRKHHERIVTLDSEAARHHRLCELNVVEQVENVSQTPVVRDAWERGQKLTVHGWIYDVADGILQDLDVSLSRGKTS